jgi:hypothetical protein
LQPASPFITSPTVSLPLLRNRLPCAQISTMLLNLSRHFCFSRESAAYDVGYLFTKDAGHAEQTSEVCLVLNITVNDNPEVVHTIMKPTSVLYQSNEAIEKMIEEETLSFL